MKQTLLAFLKIGISVGILAWLFVQAHQNAVFHDLWERPKEWSLLGLACVLQLFAVLITLIRWHFLVSALGLGVSLQGSVRIGFLGYLFNLAPLGLVGGDVLKAVMLAQRRPGRRAEAVASVFVDRAIGLYVLFLLASVSIVATAFWRIDVAAVQVACKATLVVTSVATVVGAAVLAPDITRGRATQLMQSAPYFGPPLARLLTSVRMYRQEVPVLALATVMSVVVHSLFATAVYLIAAALYDQVHTLGTHFVVTPISGVTAILPISVGPFEAVLNVLYSQVPLPEGGHMVLGQGLVVALGYRIGTVLVAAIGLGYYLTVRHELAVTMREVDTPPQEVERGDEQLAMERGNGEFIRAT